jgi:hypothetical protein
MDVHNMEDKPPVIKINPPKDIDTVVEESSPKMYTAKKTKDVIITDDVEPDVFFDGNKYIRKLVFNTTTKEDYDIYTKEEMQTANLAVLNKVVARFMKLKPNEFAEMIKSELDGKAWFR